MIQKYRVWSIDHRAMLEVYSIFWRPDGRIFIKAEAVVDCKHIDVQAFIGDKLILMQSTGLFDGSLEPVEIYKDDIVTKSLPNGAVLIGVVTFTKGMFLVDGVEAIDQSWVVIGNIHEHPDLVEVVE